MWHSHHYGELIQVLKTAPSHFVRMFKCLSLVNENSIIQHESWYGNNFYWMFVQIYIDFYCILSLYQMSSNIEWCGRTSVKEECIWDNKWTFLLHPSYGQYHDKRVYDVTFYFAWHIPLIIIVRPSFMKILLT